MILKKIIGILLVLFFVGSYAGSYLWIRHQRHRVRRELKNVLAQVNKKDLTTFSFTTAEAENLDWQNPHEFLYKGKMYDVVEKTEKNGSIIYSCWLDKEETKLNNQLNSLLDDFLANNEPLQKSKQNLLSIFKKLFNNTPSLFDWQQISLLITNFSDKAMLYSSLNLSPPSPPPKF